MYYDFISVLYSFLLSSLILSKRLSGIKWVESMIFVRNSCSLPFILLFFFSCKSYFRTNSNSGATWTKFTKHHLFHHVELFLFQGWPRIGQTRALGRFALANAPPSYLCSLLCSSALTFALNAM